MTAIFARIMIYTHSGIIDYTRRLGILIYRRKIQSDKHYNIFTVFKE